MSQGLLGFWFRLTEAGMKDLIVANGISVLILRKLQKGERGLMRKT
jgi:hypothetical protein